MLPEIFLLSGPCQLSHKSYQFFSRSWTLGHVNMMIRGRFIWTWDYSHKDVRQEAGVESPLHLATLSAGVEKAARGLVEPRRPLLC